MYVRLLGWVALSEVKNKNQPLFRKMENYAGIENNWNENIFLQSSNWKGGRAEGHIAKDIYIDR